MSDLDSLMDDIARSAYGNPVAPGPAEALRQGLRPRPAFDAARERAGIPDDFVGPPTIQQQADVEYEMAGDDRATLMKTSGGSVLSRIVNNPQRYSGIEPIEKELQNAPSADFSTRAAANVKIGREGILSYLRETLGERNVIDHKSGQIFIRTPEGTRVIDKPMQAEFGDFADISGDLIEAIPGAVATAGGGPIGRIILKGAGGDLLGTALRQGISQAMPGNDNLSVADRAKLAAGNVVAGAAGELVTRGVAKAFDVVRPGNMARKDTVPRDVLRAEPKPGDAQTSSTVPSADQANDTMHAFGNPARSADDPYDTPFGTPDYVKRGFQLEQETGVPLSLAELTGSPRAKDRESMLAQAPRTRDIMAEAKTFQQIRLGKKLDETLDRIGKRPGDEAAGSGATEVYSDYVRELNADRQKTSKRLFDDATSLAEGQPVMQVSNTIKTIQELISDHRLKLGTSSADKIVVGLERQLDRLLTDAKKGLNPGQLAQASKDKKPWWLTQRVKLTPKEFQNSLAAFSDAAYGGANVIEGLDRATDLRIARKVMKALRQDLDAAADGTGIAADVAGKLKEARETYARMSEPIDGARAKVMEKLLRLSEAGMPEKIPERMAFGWGDTQVREAVRIMNKADPVAAQQLRAQALEAIFEKAGVSASSESRELAPQVARMRGESVPQNHVTSASLARVSDKYKDRIKALFADDAQGLSDFYKIVEVARRTAGSSNIRMGGSQTMPMFLAAAAERTGIVPRWAVTAAEKAGETLTGTRGFANVVTDPAKRNEFLKLLKVGPKKQSFIEGIERLVWLQNRDALLDGDDENKAELTAEEQQLRRSRTGGQQQ